MTTHSKSELRPFIPLLVGQGKLARHLSYYLTKQNIPFKHWPTSRNLADPVLKSQLSQVNAVWILVSDRAIAEVSRQIKELAPVLPQIHSSAATDVPGVLTLHPLQTFGPDLYPLATYQTVPFTFVREEWKNESALLDAVRAAFPNPVFEIEGSKRALYHAYCVMMANFPQLLWSAVDQDAQKTLHADRALFAPILKQATENFIQQGATALTGPLVRGDLATIEKHKTALQGSPLHELYESFATTFKTPDLKTDALKKETL
jgi:hypothetical protein